MKIDLKIFDLSEAKFPLEIGRTHNCGLFFNDHTVSRSHAIISLKDNKYIITDKSSLGTFVNDKKIKEHTLENNDIIQIGSQKIVYEDQARLPHFKIYYSKIAYFTKKLDKENQDELKLGHAESNDIIINSQTIPPHFLKIKFNSKTSKCVIKSIKSKVKFKNKKRSNFSLSPGQSLYFEYFSLEFNKNFELVIYKEDPGLYFKVNNLSVTIDNKKLLFPMDFNIDSGQFIGIIGLSGQGKSTLLKAIDQQYRHEGKIKILPNFSDKSNISFLEQDSPLPPLLTLRETLEQACKIRLPAYISKLEQEKIIDDKLAFTELIESQNTLNKNLSGGERKRCALAVELISQPEALLLDEPTSGLDPTSDQKMMHYLKKLSLHGQTVIATTHNYSNLEHFDKILVINQGRLVFNGAPKNAFKFFNITHPAQILEKVAKNDSISNEERYRRSPYFQKTTFDPDELSQVPIKSINRYTSKTINYTSNFLKQLLRDKGRLALNFVQPLILGLLFLSILTNDSSRWTISFALTLSTLWYAFSISIKEIIQEKHLILAEIKYGNTILNITNYLIGKAIPLVLITTIQSLITFMIFAIPLNISVNYLWLIIAIISTALPAISLGLFASAASKSQNQAIASLPLLLIPQVIFAGAIVSFDAMPKIGQFIAKIIPSFWNYSAFKKILTDSGTNFEVLVQPLVFSIIFFIFCITLLSNKSK